MSLAASVDDICRWTGGSLHHGRPDQTFTSTVIDSRSVTSSDLFVAIVGPNHDAHRFVGEVLSKGAAGVLIQSDLIEDTLGRSDGFIIHVDDTTQALADLAHGHRQSFDGPLIAITGSNGKTTTKELCADILSEVSATLATAGNLNNNFGVPLTLLRRNVGDQFAIVEMGMNHRGEIAMLAKIAEPTIGVLTNVGSAHIEFLGSREAIALEKGDLLAALPKSGVAIVGRDEETAFAQSKRSPARVLCFGRDPRADLCASEIRATHDGAFQFMLETPFGRGEIRVLGLSETIVDNSLAAAGGALAAGASFDAVASGLANHRGVPGRMNPRMLPDDILIVDDSYNANPQSMQSALETLARLKTSGHRFAALGQMGELGSDGAEAHRDAGRLAASLSLDGLFLVGPMAELIAEGASQAGLSKDRIHIECDHDSLALTLHRAIAKGDRVLIKGSRAARMELIIDLLEEKSRS